LRNRLKIAHMTARSTFKSTVHFAKARMKFPQIHNVFTNRTRRHLADPHLVFAFPFVHTISVQFIGAVALKIVNKIDLPFRRRNLGASIFGQRNLVTSGNSLSQCQLIIDRADLKVTDIKTS
jgi:hypothetical protein